jgi:hypothetical protein
MGFPPCLVAWRLALSPRRSQHSTPKLRKPLIRSLLSDEALYNKAVVYVNRAWHHEVCFNRSRAGVAIRVRIARECTPKSPKRRFTRKSGKRTTYKNAPHTRSLRNARTQVRNRYEKFTIVQFAARAHCPGGWRRTPPAGVQAHPAALQSRGAPCRLGFPPP